MLPTLGPQFAKDNRFEVYRAYLWVMGMTLGFLVAQIILFYIPTLNNSYKALEAIQLSDDIDLGELKTSDAIYYGSYLQSSAEMAGKGTSFSMWMIASHLLLIGMAYLAEVLYANQFKNKSYYQDLTLEFKYLSDQYDDEEKIMKLFQVLSSGNVREISLLYDLSEYFGLQQRMKKIHDKEKAEGKTLSSIMHSEAVKDRVNSFQSHFQRYQGAYFLNRGFVTFNSHKMAFEMKEMYKKAYGDRPDGPIDKLVLKIQGKEAKEESAARRRFRNIVLQKVIKPKDGRRRDMLSRAVKLLFGSAGSIFNKKVGILKQEAGPKFALNRGVAAEDINWSYEPEKKINASNLALFFVVILVLLPGVMYFIAVDFYENTIQNMKGAQRGAPGFIVDKLLFVSMLGIDQVALIIIEKMLPTEGFLKSHQVLGLKFIATNLYFLVSGLLFLFLGLVVAANREMAEIVSEKERFSITKQVLDSFYMTFLALIISNVNTIIFSPVYKFYFKEKGKAVPRDITLTLSFMCLAIYYVGFFAPFDINIILIMAAAVLLLVVAELVLYRFGIVEPMRVSYSILGNYFLALIWGLLPITLSAYLMLEGNHMGIKTLSLGLKDSLFITVVLLAYLILVSVFTLLYKNERLLRRIQSRVWNVNSSMSAPEIILGSSYRELNPIYSFQGKLKSD